MRNLRFFLIALLLVAGPCLHADEGMWLPMLLKQLNEGEMQSMGMKMSAEDIYSVNQSSLKDAVVMYGSGCTGSIISEQGLMITNHHCGLGRIQSHSSVENDYLTDGFWAEQLSDELPNPGLTATFIVRMEDVTDKILKGVTDEMDENQRAGIIQENTQFTGLEAISGTHYGAIIRPFFHGNEYYMFIVETFKDVRLVGAPPSSIGKFGGDTDNWMWPRHNADFALFRIYSGPDGKPADYSPDNIPLKPRHFLPISLKEKQENDFTLVYGFPGSTNQYVTSYAIDLIQNIDDPVKIQLRDLRLNIMDREMLASDKVRIQYASKQSRISNGYKKWKGEIRGLKKANAIEKRQEKEKEFQKRVNAKPGWKTKYGNLLPRYKEVYSTYNGVIRELEYYLEAGMAIEAVKKAANLQPLAALLEMGKEADQEELEARISKHTEALDRSFKNYSELIDRQIAGALLDAYMKDIPADRRPPVLEELIGKKFGGDAYAFANHMFEKSIVVDQERMRAFLEKPKLKALQKDPAFVLMEGLQTHYDTEIKPAYKEHKDVINLLNRTYMEAQRNVFSEQAFYPDANLTLRVTYGKVEGYSPTDGVKYNFYTTLDGVVEKHLSYPENPEFKLPKKLVDLHASGDFGRYAQDGKLWTCFTASNHTSGGNSGSPVIDGEGNLVGVNFDRNWEGTMSDLNYDITQCRNISVDIRYVLFIVDRYAGADRLMAEMKIVK